MVRVAGFPQVLIRRSSFKGTQQEQERPWHSSYVPETTEQQAGQSCRGMSAMMGGGAVTGVTVSVTVTQSCSDKHCYTDDEK